jgi:beta-N-acetylglucosaminidase/RNase P/RNase MRP subunit p29
MRKIITVTAFILCVSFYLHNYQASASTQDELQFNSAETIKTPIVHYNWGQGNPEGLPKDQFFINFDQSKNFTAGDYFLQTNADDGVRVTVDGEKKIDRLDYSADSIDRALLLGLSEGSHEVKTNYYEGVLGAYVYSDTVPLGDWLAYYYSGTSASGSPEAAKVIPSGDNLELFEPFNYGSPAEKIPSNGFSARYSTAKKIPAGDYVLRAWADDGVQVYVDGKLVLDRYTYSSYREDAVKIHIADRTDTNNENEKNVHWIEVRYKDVKGYGRLYFSMQPYSEVKNLKPADGWLGEIYNNPDFKGDPVILGGIGARETISDLDYYWGRKSPSPMIKSDNYSGRFIKKYAIDQPGMYTLSAVADDGFRVYVDGKNVWDSWDYEAGDRTKDIYLDSGVHEVKIDFHEGSLSSRLHFNLTEAKKDLKKKQKAVHYNWGQGSPTGLPNDYFTATFDQSQYLNAGDYFIQTLADDGVKVSVNGVDKIDRWEYSPQKINQSLLVGVKAQEHKIITRYREAIKAASVFSDVVPLGDWLAYYYPNTTLAGSPTVAKVIESNDSLELFEANDHGSPDPKIPDDYFSARYVTAKRIPAGDYVLRARADDGVQIYVDGKLVLDRFTTSSYREDAVKVHISDNQNASQNEKDIHWIEVRYKEVVKYSRLYFYMQPYDDAKNITTTDGWFGEFFNNTSLTGNSVVVGGNGSSNSIDKLDYYWGRKSPANQINSDSFSARFTKKLKIDSDGTYNFRYRADDGIRIYIDGERVVDSWDYVTGDLREFRTNLTAGVHDIKVEYFEGKLSAKLMLDIVESDNVIYEYSNYDYSFESMLNIQMDKVPSTDLYGPYGYVHKNFIIKDPDNSSKYIVVLDSGYLNVRETAPSGRVVGKLYDGDNVSIADTEGDWHKIWFTWKYAKREDVAYYLNPLSFSPDTPDYFQFLKLSKSAGVNADEVNQKILAGKGILEGKAQAFIDAAKKYSINEVYLMSHALLESGNGTSALATGIVVDKVDGKAVEPKKVYNMYGIGAYDKCAVTCGAEYAYKAGWFTPELAIIGGAQFVSENYIHAGQDTLYKMRWNPDHPGTHQYATDIGWAAKQTYRITDFYDLLSNYTLVFDVPHYK